MPRYKVLITDYAWRDLDIEQVILSKIDAQLVVAQDQHTETLARLAVEVDAIMTCWAKVSEQVILSAPHLRIVARFGIGLDNIDIQCCTRNNIVVTNVPDYCQTEVAEHTLALLLSLGRKTAFFHWQTKQGRYDLQAGGAFHRIEGQTLGIIGLGNIGRCLAEKAMGIGMNVVATRRSRQELLRGVTFCDLDELLTRSDYVSLHLPLTPQTKHIIAREQLAKMKPSAFLINTARGDLIDHAALTAALECGELAGAALDVQSPEPPDLTEPPYSDARVIVTPHAAFVSVESIENLRTRTANQVATLLSGGLPENAVNPEVLP